MLDRLRNQADNTVSHSSAAVRCRMSCTVAELVTLRASGSRTVAPKLALKLLTSDSGCRREP